MVDAKLVQIGVSADPSDAKETERRPGPNLRDEPRELALLGQRGPAFLGEPSERYRQHQTGAGNRVALTQHEVGGEVSGGPTFDQRWRVSSEFVQQVAQGKSLVRVKRKIGHITYGANVIRSVWPFAHAWIADRVIVRPPRYPQSRSPHQRNRA